MKKKIVFSMLMLIAIKNFSQDISLTASGTTDSLSRHNSSAAMEQKQVLYRQIMENETGDLSLIEGKNFMHSLCKRYVIDTNLIIPQKHSVWKSAGVGMITGLVIVRY